MAYISASAPNQANSYGVKSICSIVGLVCIVGFFFDILVVGLPPQLSVEWRIGFIQEFANRSIILLFGLALYIFGSTGKSRGRLKLLSQLSMGIGVLFFLLCIVSVVDSIRLNQRALANISTQEAELQTQIQDAKANPEGLPENIDLAGLEQVSQQLTERANTLKSNAKRTAIKTGISNVGNLFVVGAGLLGLGRCGMGLARSRG